MIALSNGITVKLMPETAVDLIGSDNSGLPVFQVEYGRVVMMTAGKPDIRVKLILGNTAGVLTFFRSRCNRGRRSAAYPPSRHRPTHRTFKAAGSPLRNRRANRLDRGTRGEAGASTVAAPADELLGLPNGGKLTPPARLVLAGSSDDLPGGQHELPRWYINEQTSSLDARASKTKKTLENRTSVTVGLKELVEHRMLGIVRWRHVRWP